MEGVGIFLTILSNLIKLQFLGCFEGSQGIKTIEICGLAVITEGLDILPFIFSHLLLVKILQASFIGNVNVRMVSLLEHSYLILMSAILTTTGSVQKSKAIHQ